MEDEEWEDVLVCAFVPDGIVKRQKHAKKGLKFPELLKEFKIEMEKCFANREESQLAKQAEFQLVDIFHNSLNYNTGPTNFFSLGWGFLGCRKYYFMGYEGRAVIYKNKDLTRS